MLLSNKQHLKNDVLFTKMCFSVCVFHVLPTFQEFLLWTFSTDGLCWEAEW